MKKLFLILTLSLILIYPVSAASQDARHPLSQIYPTDTDFNASGYKVFNASSFELQNGFDISGYTFSDQGSVGILEWDPTNTEWVFRNGNVNLNGYNITNIDTLSFVSGLQIDGSVNLADGDVNLNNGSINDIYSIDGGGNAIRFDDVIDMNSNSINSLNNIDLSGGNGYIIQNSDGDNVYLQADDDSGARSNFLSVDPDSRTVSVPSGDLSVSGLTDGVDLDSPGNALTLDGSSRYAVSSGSIDSNELVIDSVTVNSGSYLTGGGTVALGGSTTLNVDGGSVLGSANDLDSNGNINDFSGGNDLNSNGGVTACDGDADCNIQRLDFQNEEQPASTDGRVYFDENFYSDYGSISGDGGGLAVYSQDGWGAVMTTSIDDHITPTFNGLNLQGNLNMGAGDTLNMYSGNIHHTSTGSASGIDMRFRGGDNAFDFERYDTPSIKYMTIDYGGNSAEVTFPSSNVDLTNSNGFQLPTGADAY